MTEPKRNVIVTGGSRGLGLAIVAQLAADGDRVIAIARGESAELAAVRGAAEREGRGAVRFVGFDLLDLKGLGALVAGLRAEHGPLYGLVNNAGIGTHGLLALTRDEEIERVVRLNTIAPIVLAKHVLRSMLTEKAGRIVNIASVVAESGASGLAAYAATKAALVGFTRSLAREAGPLGITVNAIAPGFIDTEMTRSLTDPDRERITRRSALRRLPEPRDVAAAVRYLLSDEARNLTGITLKVDAGLTA